MRPRIRVAEGDQLARSLAQTRYHGVQFPGHGRRRLSRHHDRGRAAYTGRNMCRNGLANRGKAGIEIVVKHEYGFNVAGIVVVQRSGEVLAASTSSPRTGLTTVMEGNHCPQASPQ